MPLNIEFIGNWMFHIVFNADEKYIPYAAVLMTSIIKNTNPNKTFADFCVDSNQNETINSSGGGGGIYKKQIN